ncbi:MAG: hypothetical protein WD049_00640 [Candidatus Paceibacterota bacterium]
MDYELNPFQVLYVTDSPDPKVFVKLFSPVLIEHAQVIFKPGNVVVRGMQGSGKSMLLNLLRPQIRLAYHKAESPFPVPTQLSRFVGAGINLTRSGILDIGQLPISEDTSSDSKLFPLFFADFLNYFVVQDILGSLTLMAENPRAFSRLARAEKFDEFAETLASDACWFDALAGCDTFEKLRSRITRRLASYRAFHQYNIRRLPDEIRSTKTAIGEPITRVERALKACGVIDEDTAVRVRIDQVERLLSSDVLRPELGTQYRRMINKLLSLRGSGVSYCIGVRTYAWGDDLAIYETDDRVELIRDFRFFDLDELLRRQESQKTWVFPDFAEDVFSRRLKHVGIADNIKERPINKIFGSSPTPKSIAEKARQYCKNKPLEKIAKLSEVAPPEWKDFLQMVYDRDPLEAKLASAWAMQRGRAGKRGARLSHPPPRKTEPWKKQYWRKDRDRMALLQIEGNLAQRSSWHGASMLVALSSGNISVFISLCHEIWDAHLRAERRKRPQERRNPIEEGFTPDVQAVGVQTASAYWYDKIPEQPRGHDRQRFVDVLGRMFRKWAMEDISLSYPGHNGFSLTKDDLDANPEIAKFLEEAADFGDLFDAEHTTKERDRRQRVKWYLMPILSDYFQIREAHTREPYYASIENVIAWLDEAGIRLAGVDYSMASKQLKRSASALPPSSLF